MDENFISELVAEKEKRFGFEIPLSMTFSDALNSLKGTLDEVISASDNWNDQEGLKHTIAVEARAWREIFKKALEVAGADELSMVNTLAENDNADKLVGLANSGNKLMKHFYMSGESASDVLKMSFVFRTQSGIQIQATVDFG